MLPRTPYIKPTFKLILESAVVKSGSLWLETLVDLTTGQARVRACRS
jgi:hypothetical protein